MSTSVLITGATGYLGGRLCQFLAAASGFRVRMATRRATDNLPDWAGAFEHVRLDLESDESLDVACRDIDVIIHLAAVNAQEAAADPARADEVNVGGTERLIAAAARAGVKRAVYVSTIHVYGARLQGTIDETTPPRPAHPYASTHLAAENIVLTEPGLTGVVLRLSNSLGAPADATANCWMLVANDLCRQAVREKQIQLAGDGSGVRDFVCMSDVLRALAHVARLPTADLGERLFNVGAGSSISIRDLAQRVAERTEQIFSYRPPVITGPPSGVSVEPLSYLSQRIAATGFRYQGDLDRELDETLRFCAETP